MNGRVLLSLTDDARFSLADDDCDPRVEINLRKHSGLAHEVINTRRTHMMSTKRRGIRLAAAAAIGAIMAAGTWMAHAAAQAETLVKPQYFSFKGKRPSFDEENVRQVQVVISAADSAGRQSLIESYWTPKFAVKPHFHKKHAETFYVLSGQVEWTVDGETHVLNAGDAVHIPPYTVHSVKVVGDKDMHSLMLYEPGGFEEYSAYDEKFTPEQRKDPQLMKQLNELADFHLVTEK
jgi:quercetin dioxygenase-like cupin family protein